MLIIQAIQDAHAGRACGSRCRRRPYTHPCAADALDFLRSDDCSALLEALDLDPKQIEEVLANPLPDIQRLSAKGRKSSHDVLQDKRSRRLDAQRGAH